MNLLSELEAAMRYVEAHIDDELGAEQVAAVTSYSPYHFGRLFYYIAGISLSEYIRRRKLSLAAAELQTGAARVLDLAVKYGYDSADSFSRAFAKQHGVTPTAARRPGVTLKIFSPLTFQITVKGVNEMNMRIEEHEAFEVFGIERVFANGEDELVPDFWTELRQSGEYEKLARAAGAHNADGRHGVNAVCGHYETGEDSFPYMLFAVKRPDSVTDGYKIARIPKATWAIFRNEKTDRMGSEIPNLFSRAYSEWLPSSGYDKAPGPDNMEIYYSADRGGYFEEVWVPVRKLL
ncbi:MAG: AraC family transcriptional regulator [Oscillospiraceae bacterium]|jgi:AraC family transcriptional regulator|nr:AraC family transcriptional regulator [Oscillospiraceae bacterium]